MLSEIGSNFWINPYEVYDEEPLISPEIFGITGSDYSWLSTGRSAISMVLETIEQRDPNINKVAVIPAFTCATVVEPFLKAGYEVKTLPIDDELCTSGNEILYAVEKNGASVLLVHRYFGFDTITDWKEPFDRIRRLGVKIIEDKTQCLYSGFQNLSSDYIIGSIRKWLGVPDGAFMVCTEGKFNYKPVESNKALEKAKIEASILKYKYLLEGEGDKTSFLDKYKIAEDILDHQEQPFLICNFSLKIQARFDITGMSDKRRQNYLYLLKTLDTQAGLRPVFSALPANVTPLYYPVIAKDRKRLQQHLIDSKIYAPVIWPKADVMPVVCAEADYLYHHLLCIPIDQRYDCDDMKRIVDCIERYCK